MNVAGSYKRVIARNRFVPGGVKLALLFEILSVLNIAFVQTLCAGVTQPCATARLAHKRGIFVAENLFDIRRNCLELPLYAFERCREKRRLIDLSFESEQFDICPKLRSARFIVCYFQRFKVPCSFVVPQIVRTAQKHPYGRQY